MARRTRGCSGRHRHAHHRRCRQTGRAADTRLANPVVPTPDLVVQSNCELSAVADGEDAAFFHWYTHATLQKRSESFLVVKLATADVVNTMATHHAAIGHGNLGTRAIDAGTFHSIVGPQSAASVKAAGTTAGRRMTRRTSGCRKQAPLKSRGRTEPGMRKAAAPDMARGHDVLPEGPQDRHAGTCSPTRKPDARPEHGGSGPPGTPERNLRHQGNSPPRSRENTRALGEDESLLGEGHDLVRVFGAQRQRLRLVAMVVRGHRLSSLAGMGAPLPRGTGPPGAASPRQGPTSRDVEGSPGVRKLMRAC
ncbi:hypothetical protein ON010_g10914 [Phytophthora cinnamomi]|nr:hypothetical protein ON010_g10914 [Phytophthora cinnamomi]